MNDPANGSVPDSTWVVMQIVRTMSGAIAEPVAHIDGDKGDAQKLCKEMLGELNGFIQHNPAIRKVFQSIGIQGIDFRAKRVPRHSTIVRAPANSPLIVGKA